MRIEQGKTVAMTAWCQASVFSYDLAAGYNLKVTTEQEKFKKQICTKCKFTLKSIARKGMEGELRA